MRLFEARYPGTCSECGYSFDEGELIGYVDDDLCCEDCCELHQRDDSEWGWVGGVV